MLTACSNLADYPFLESWIVGPLQTIINATGYVFVLLNLNLEVQLTRVWVLSSNFIKTIISMATYVFNTSQEIDTERKRLIIHIKTPKAKIRSVGGLYRT